jgi:hypothetical protein
VAEQGLVRGKRIGVDASTMEANAALRTIVRRDDGRTYLVWETEGKRGNRYRRFPFKILGLMII